MKKGLFLLVGGIVLVVSIFLISFYSWNYFNKREPKASKVDLNTLEIVLSDDGNLDLKDQAPVDDATAKKVTPYSFKVNNKSASKVKYQLLIEDYVSDDSTQLLSRNYLKYELSQDGVVVKSGKLSDIKNNILEENKISAKEERKYELRVWIDETASATEWVGKSYNYNIKLNPIVD